MHKSSHLRYATPYKREALRQIIRQFSNLGCIYSTHAVHCIRFVLSAKTLQFHPLLSCFRCYNRRCNHFLVINYNSIESIDILLMALK